MNRLVFFSDLITGWKRKEQMQTPMQLFVNRQSEVQTQNNHTQAGDQNFHSKLPPQWLKSLQTLLWAFQSSFHCSSVFSEIIKLIIFFWLQWNTEHTDAMGKDRGLLSTSITVYFTSWRVQSSQIIKGFYSCNKNYLCQMKLFWCLTFICLIEMNMAVQKVYQVSTEVSCVGKCQNIKMEDLLRKCVHSAISLCQSCTTSCCWSHGLPQQQDRQALSIFCFRYL